MDSLLSGRSMGGETRGRSDKGWSSGVILGITLKSWTEDDSQFQSGTSKKNSEVGREEDWLWLSKGSVEVPGSHSSRRS